MCGPHLLRHEPSRVIGGEPMRREDSPPHFCSYGRGQTASRQAARRVNLPSGGRFSNITEDVRKYAAEPSGANRSAAEIARQTPLSTNAGKQIIRRMTRRASRVASQRALSDEEALQRGMVEKPKESVEADAEASAKARL